MYKFFLWRILFFIGAPATSTSAYVLCRKTRNVGNIATPEALKLRDIDGVIVTSRVIWAFVFDKKLRLL